MEMVMRFLIVDDVPAMRMFLRTVLSSLRAAIDEASDGVEALWLLANVRYDLVLLDLNLPLLDGMKVLARVHAGSAQHHPPVIIVSTISDSATLARAKSLGAIQVLSKPIDSVALLDTVRAAVRVPESGNSGARRARRRVRLSAQIRFSGDDEAVDATTFDISAGGAFIVSEHINPPGMVGKAVFTAPHLNAPVEVDFGVVHVRATAVGALPVGMGIRFVNVTSQLQKELFKLLASPAA
jgi:two-component system chemotaxis response regulator CheY